MEPTLNDIDEMIVHEKMQAALEYQNEAWADGMADGIEAEIIADAAIALALRETIRVHARSCGAAAAACPRCGTISRHVHSRYWRQPADLPAHGRAVALILLVRRFRCRVAHCLRAPR